MSTSIPAEHATPSRIGWPEIGVGLTVTVVLLAVGVVGFLAIPPEHAALIGLAQYAVSGLAPLGGFLAAVTLRVRDVKAFGLRRVSGKWLLVAVAVGIGVVGLKGLLTSLMMALFPDMAHVQANYQAAATGGLVALLAALVFGAVLTPVGEELLFRGVLTNALSRYGAWVAVLVSSAVFALAHGINHALPAAFVVGVTSALLLRRTRSLWPGVVVHSVNNLSAVIIPAVLVAAA